MQMASGEYSVDSFSLSTQPKIVGGYDITGGDGGAYSTAFMYYKKPSWFHRITTRMLLGWKWFDKK